MIKVNEAELIEAVKSGSAEAFNEIYRMYAQRLYAFCMRWSKRSEDAQDIVQEVFAKIWNERHAIRQTETLEHLVFIMARHSLINAFRATLRNPAFEDYTEYRDRLPADNGGDHLEYSEFLTLVSRAVDSLPDTRSKVVRLSKIEGHSNREIADMLSLSEQTVRNQLSLGLKEVRQIVGAHLHYFAVTLFFCGTF